MNNNSVACSQLQSFDLASKICLNSPKSRAVVMSVLLLLLISKYDEFKTSLISSVRHKQFKKMNFVTSDAKKNPEIAWLLSFPNSGTSFTTALVRTLTETSTATNYEETKHPAAVFPEMSISPLILRKKLPLPEKGFILTKTHCTRCAGEQKSVIKTADEFVRGCQSMNTDGSCHQYETDIVKRAVHLFRNPFDNVVGRFHLEFKGKNKKGDTEWTDKYPYSKEGFHQWCNNYSHHQHYKPDANFLESLKNSGVLCPIEFFLYVQFHNNALDTTNSLNIPVHIIDYTDYHADYNGTVNDLLAFLELDQVPGTEKSFFMSSHEDFYTSDERRDIANFLLQHASPETWDHLYYKYLGRIL